MSAPTLERELTDEAESQADTELDSVECATGLKAETGDRTQCEVAVQGVRATWDVEVTSVEGSTINFEWEVQDGSQLLETEALLGSIGPDFEQQIGLELAGITCPQPLIEGTVGTTVVCEATTTNGRTGDIEITVTSASGMKVDFSWRPLDG